MPTVDVYNTSGRKLSKVTLPKEIFGVKPNPVLMTQAVRVYLSNQRQSPAKTKRRGEIVCSKRKIWRQKGTGRARHGSRNAPIFVKGAVAHGPTGEQNYKLSLNKKMRKLALKSALSGKLTDKEIVILQGLEKIKGKTREMDKVVLNIKNQILKIKNDKRKFKATIVLPKVLENVIRAGRNLPYLNFLQARQLNTYEVLNGGLLVFDKESLKVLETMFTSGVEASLKTKT